jgi:hypothetical protein
MRTIARLVVAVGILGVAVAAQERKPVPKDSVRVSIPGCTKGYVFTAGPKTTDEPGSFEIPEGMHLRMNGPKKMMGEIKEHEGSAVEITGVMRKGQYKEGIDVGHGVRIMPGASPTSGTMAANMNPNPIQIDVEGWRPIMGSCKTK